MLAVEVREWSEEMLTDQTNQVIHSTLGQSVTAGKLDMALNYHFQRGLSSEMWCEIHPGIERMRLILYRHTAWNTTVLHPAGVADCELLP